jgi:hypothetical protein
MAWITPTIAAVGALGSAALNAGRSNQQQTQNQDLQYQALADARQNQLQQSIVQALINRRSVAGQADSFGSTLQYDPGTNTWVSKLGPLPEAATRAAQQAAISRNTTDLRQAQFANEQAALRASRAGPAADAAQRDLANFRPMGSDQLVGLLGQQATLANQNTFRPLVADTLRSFARTGTAAGPVLGQIGRDAATNLRQSLIDAQIKGMTSVDQINQGRRQALEQTAANTATLASPQFQYSGISPTGIDNTMAQTVAARAQQGAVAPAYGMAGANTASKAASDAYGTAGKNIADPNYGLTAAGSVLKDISTAAGKGGAISDLITALSSGGSGNKGDLSGYTPYATSASGFGAGDATQDPNSYWS